LVEPRPSSNVDSVAEGKKDRKKVGEKRAGEWRGAETKLRKSERVNSRELKIPKVLTYVGCSPYSWTEISVAPRVSDRERIERKMERGRRGVEPTLLRVQLIG
jgi:hypothetical protein